MMKFITKIGNPLVLGATKLNKGVNFAIAVEECDKCPTLKILKKGTYEELAELTFDEKMQFGNVYAMEVSDFDTKKYDYIYMNGEHVVPDKYAKIINNRDNFGVRSVGTYSVYENKYTWQEEKVYVPFDDAIIYRMHVRGFTAHKSSGTRYKGTFKGIVSKLPYLKELGVNVIELMPAYEFNEMKSSALQDDSINYWGYSDGYYFAPKAAYASKPKEASREFKDMVQAIHNAGMELIMEFHFVEDMKPQVIMDCIRYWVMEYHIDGVHMNINTVPVNMLKSDPLLANIKIIGDRWELVSQDYKPSVEKNNLSICHDGFMCTMRRFLKGDEGLVYEMSSRMKENPKDACFINFVSSHNSFTLMDSVSYDRKHNEANGENNQDGSNLNYSWNCGVEGPTRKKRVVELRRKQIKNALSMLFLSQGVPLLMAGDEMGKSCDGNNNPYCIDGDINYINWNDLKKNKDIYEFVKYIIEFRKNHKILHLKEEPRMMDYLSKGCPDLSIHGIEPWRPDFNYVSRCFGMLYNEAYDDKKGKLYIMFNMYWESQEFNIPASEKKMRWKLEFSTADEKNIDCIVGRVFNMAPRSIAVLREV
ncbi:MAG: alpha-amylase [Lachnospiraceae bacterium]|nr:alpha-amylase [Lachnospiraceae bacterium]